MQYAACLQRGPILSNPSSDSGHDCKQAVRVMIALGLHEVCNVIATNWRQSSSLLFAIRCLQQVCCGIAWCCQADCTRFTVGLQRVCSLGAFLVGCRSPGQIDTPQSSQDSPRTRKPRVGRPTYVPRSRARHSANFCQTGFA